MANDEFQTKDKPGEASAGPAGLVTEKISEIEDLILVNKLDIINLKNEMEKLRITAALPSPDVMEGIKQLADLAHQADEFRKWKRVADDVQKLKEQAIKSKPLNFDAIEKNIKFIDQRLSMLEEGAGLREKNTELVKEYDRQVERIKSMSVPDFEKRLQGIEEKLHLHAQKVQSLATVLEKSPPDTMFFMQKMSKLASEIASVRQQIETAPEKNTERPEVVRVIAPVADEAIKRSMESFSEALKELNDKIFMLNQTKKVNEMGEIAESVESLKETLNAIYEAKKTADNRLEALESAVKKLSSPPIPREYHDMEKLKIIMKGLEDDVATIKLASYRQPTEKRGPSAEVLARKIEEIQKSMAALSSKLATLEIPWIPPEVESVPKKVRSLEENFKYLEESVEMIGKRIRDAENTGSEMETKVRGLQKLEEDLILHQQHELMKARTDITARVDEMESKLRREANIRAAEKIVPKEQKDKVNKIVDEYIKSRIDRRAREEFKAVDALKAELAKFDARKLEEKIYSDVLQKLLGGLTNDKR
jgi:hypothetical protein